MFPFEPPTEIPVRPADALFPERRQRMAEGICVDCGKTITGFRDALSRKEWTLTGWCQTCQDSFFVTENNPDDDWDDDWDDRDDEPDLDMGLPPEFS